jgi:hypothetical protein
MTIYERRENDLSPSSLHQHDHQMHQRILNLHPHQETWYPICNMSKSSRRIGEITPKEHSGTTITSSTYPLFPFPISHSSLTPPFLVFHVSFPLTAVASTCKGKASYVPSLPRDLPKPPSRVPSFSLRTICEIRPDSLL